MPPKTEQTTEQAGAMAPGDLKNLLQKLLEDKKERFKLPRYSGKTDVETYIRQFEEIAELNGWTVRARLVHLRGALEHDAVACAGGESEVALLQSLRATFGVNKSQAFQQLLTMKKKDGERFQDLGNRIKLLARVAGLDDSGTLEVFKRTLEPQVQIHLTDSITTLEQAVQRAQQVSQLMTAAAVPKVSAVAVAGCRCEEISTEIKALCESFTSKPKSDNRESSASRGGTGCFTCGGPHLARNCPRNKKRAGSKVSARLAPVIQMGKNTRSPQYSTVDSTRNPDVNQQYSTVDCEGYSNKLKLATCSSHERTKNSPSSYYAKGKVQNRIVTFLLDSGCTRNVISQHVYARLPQLIKQLLQPYDASGIMADGSKVSIHGKLRLSVRLEGMTVEEEFLVAHIKDDAILGLSFFERYGCVLDFISATLQIKDRKIKCCDRFGRRLTAPVIAVNKMVIPARSEMLVPCMMKHVPSGSMGIVESFHDQQKVQVATTLHSPGQDRAIMVRCLNVTCLPVEIHQQEVVAFYQSVDDQEPSVLSEDRQEPSNMNSVHFGHSNQEFVPPHLEGVFHSAKEVCRTEAEKSRLAMLLKQFSDVFSKHDGDIGRTHLVTHSVPIVPGTMPIRHQPRRLGPEKEMEVDRQVQKLVDEGIIEPSDGAWSSPVVLVKKRDGSWRFCIDYRKLNSVTITDAYPLPRIDESLDALAGSKYFSSLDLSSGYWQVPLDEEAQTKSAFVTRNGLWKWKVLPFGLCSAPATFERMMETALRGLHWKTVLIYLDDVIVFSSDFDSHLQRLETVFRRLHSAGLKLKPKKCHLLQTEVKYLGHVVCSKGVTTDPDKITAVRDWPPPSCVSQLKAYLGTVGYYRKFCKDFADVAAPLNRLTQKNERFVWSTECQEAFEQLKQSLLSAPTLGYPDPTLPYILDADASNNGVGAVLSQLQDGHERVIAYYSKSLSKPERNYCVTRKELLAVIKAIKHFKPYLWGSREFVVRSDHASLQWLLKQKEPNNQVARWLEFLADYKFAIHHRKGVDHTNADGLSRQHCGEECRQCKKMGKINVVKDESFDCGNSVFVQRFNDSSTSDGTSASPQVSGQTSAADVLQVLPVDEELAQMQRQEPSDVATVYEAVNDGCEVSPSTIHFGSWELKKLSKLQHRMHISDEGVLNVRLHVGGRQRHCVVCPRSLRESVIWKTHTLCHAGLMKTLKRISLSWYWPGMTSDVRRAVGTCEICQMAKHGGLKPTQGRRHLHCGRPGQKVAIDLVGPLSTTRDGYVYILVLTDHFSRWQDALPLKSASASEIAETFFVRYISCFGVPEEIHSDLGTQFQSELLHELCVLCNMNHTNTTPYRPQSNGIVERGNKMLGDALRAKLLDKPSDDWDKILPHLMMAMRATPHSSTSETANFVMFGRELRLPDTIAFGQSIGLSQSQEVSQFCKDLQERMNVAHDFLRKHEKLIRQEDTDEPLLFSPGDLVLMINTKRRKGRGSKLTQKFVGPFEVAEARDNHVYVIEGFGKKFPLNEGRLKLFKPCTVDDGRVPGTDSSVTPESSASLSNRGRVGSPPHALNAGTAHLADAAVVNDGGSTSDAESDDDDEDGDFITDMTTHQSESQSPDVTPSAVVDDVAHSDSHVPTTTSSSAVSQSAEQSMIPVDSSRTSRSGRIIRRNTRYPESEYEL